jgi:flagellar hook-length control protein FliK
MQTAQVAALSQATGGAPAGSVKVTASSGSNAAPSSAPGAGSAAAAQSIASSDAQTATPITAVTGQSSNQNGGQTGDQSSGASSDGTSNPGGSAPPASPVFAPLAGGGQTASASAPATSTQTDSASASGDTQTPVAFGPLGDPSLIQQVPITAQGAGSAPSDAVLPPGTDKKTLALDPAAGGSTALTGDVASAATAAASQGVVQTEGPSAANSTASAAGFDRSLLAATANPAEQVKIQLTKGLKDGSDSINVLLHPEDLGTVEVKLQLQDGQVKATISADNADTLALLKNDSHQLTQQLQNAGFNTDSNSLSFQMRGEQQQNSGLAGQQQGQSNSQSSNSGSNASAYTTDSDIDEQVLTATAKGASSAGGLDISV